MFILTVTHGPDRGRQIRIVAGKTYTIGTGESDSMVLTDPKVLAGHCSVALQDGGVVVENHTASAGTYVGDKRIKRAKLPGNTSFRIGDSEIALREASRNQPAPDSDPLIGKIVGGYHVKEVVGRGGMGTVYRATQLSLHRDVALKVLSPDLAKDTSFRNLFIQEARAAGQLVHPNVVQVYDAGTEGEVSFFSMEFIGQGSVEEILGREGKIPWERAILMVLEACHGLEYAEKRQIVHRDIKPDNLMINEDGRVKIADLGLAKRGEGAGSDQGIIGTPHFIPPEQALGKEVDTRADLYSLGATFFRMITGKTVFTGKSAKEIVLKHIKEPPPAASSVEKGIPSELDLVLAKLLAKDPAQRYQNAAELIAALEEICANHGIKGAVIRKGVPKKVLIPMVALLLAAVGTAIFLFTRDPRDPEAERIAAEAAARARELEKEAQAAAEREQELLRGNKEKEAHNRYLEITGRIYNSIRDLHGDIDETYLEEEKAEQREAAWLGLADTYDEFAAAEENRKYAPQADLDGATAEANRIRERLKVLKATNQSRVDFIKAKEKEIVDLDNALRLALKRLSQKRYWQQAYDLAVLVADGAEKGPADVDPALLEQWRKLPEEEWVSPSETKRAREFRDLAEAIEKTKQLFLQERRDLIPKQIKGDWEAVKAEVGKLEEAATEEALAAARKELEEVIDCFPKGGVGELEMITVIVAEAKERLAKVSGLIDQQRKERLRKDRNVVGRARKQICTLNPNSVANYVMNLQLTEARNELNDLKGKLDSDAYRAFVEQQLEMIDWMQWLFHQFHKDVAATAAGSDGPLVDLTLTLPARAGEKDLSGKFDHPPAGRFDQFTHTRRRNEALKFADYPMNWVYEACFRVEGKDLRWKPEHVTPVLQYALGIFCFQTFQFEESIGHFRVVEADERYGASAKALIARAQKEAAALAEYESLLAAPHTAATSAELKKALEALQSFQTRHEGTLTVLDLLPFNEEFQVDFFVAGQPKIPEAPPPPPLTE